MPTTLGTSRNGPRGKSAASGPAGAGGLAPFHKAPPDIEAVGALNQYPFPMRSDDALSQALAEYYSQPSMSKLFAGIFPWASSSNLPLIISIQDFSTSMTSLASLVSEAQSLTQNVVSQNYQQPSTSPQILQFGLNRALFNFTGSEPVSINRMKFYSTTELGSRRDEKSGGLLEGGSRLSDGYYLGASLAAAVRILNPARPVLVMLTADGDNRYGSALGSERELWDPRSCKLASKSVALAREAGATLRFFAYVKSEDVQRMDAFRQRIGLGEDECFVNGYDHSNARARATTVALVANAQSQTILKFG